MPPCALQDAEKREVLGVHGGDISCQALRGRHVDASWRRGGGAQGPRHKTETSLPPGTIAHGGSEAENTVVIG